MVVLGSTIFREYDINKSLCSYGIQLAAIHKYNINIFEWTNVQTTASCNCKFNGAPVTCSGAGNDKYKKY